MKAEERIVVFLDVLGSKNRVDMSSDEDIEDFYYIYEIMHRLSERAKEYKINTFCFSDCMYAITEIEHVAELFDFIAHACIMELLSSPEKIEVNIDVKGCVSKSDVVLLRGGISMGTVIYNQEDNILFGKAVNRAYILESEKAIYPRIVLDEHTHEELTQKELIPKDYIKKDNGVCFFDFIKWLKEKNKIRDGEIVSIKQKISDEISSKNCGQQEVVDKLKWFNEYLHSCI